MQLLEETSVVVKKQLKYLVDAFFRTCPSYAFELQYHYPDDDELPTVTVRRHSTDGPPPLTTFCSGLISQSGGQRLG